MKKRSANKASSFLIIISIVFFFIIMIVFIMNKGKPVETAVVFVHPSPAFVDHPAPEFFLRDMSGSSASLSDLAGKVVLVNNWATWCLPCREEIPALQSYFEAHVQDDFILVGINAGDRKEQIMRFIDENELTFPICEDPMGEALRAFKNNGLPSSYVIDQDGSVRMAWMGKVTVEALEAYVTPFFVE